MLRGIRSRYLRNAFKLHTSILAVITCLLLLGVASPLSAQVTTTQPSVNFGSVAVGAGLRQSLPFTVPSGITLGSVSAVTQGAPSLDYTVGSASTCASGTTNSTCVLQVRFRPTTAGLRTGAVVLTDQSGNTLITVPLSGIGSGPLVSFGPDLITTVAGDGCDPNDPSCVIGDGGPATSAQLNHPSGVALDGAGNIYIADSSNNRIRKVTPGGTITTVAGGGSGCAGQTDSLGDGCAATSAELDIPLAIAVDGAGDLYIADIGNSRIRKVTPGGIITTVAGNGSCAVETNYECYNGDHIPATAAELDFPNGVAVDGAGNLYIGDTANNRVRKVTTDGTITTVAGNGTPCPSVLSGVSCYNGDNIPATTAQLNYPSGLTLDATGNLYIAEQYDYRVRMVTPGGIISTVAGIGGECPFPYPICYNGDNIPATTAELDFPNALALDGAGNLYIADDLNLRVRMVSAATGLITTVAGNGYTGPGGVYGGYNGDNIPATSAELNFPAGVALDGAANIYIADQENGRIRRVDVSTPPSLTFANTTVEQASAAQDITVLNLGNAPLNIGHISVANNFSLSGPNTSCSRRGQTLDAAESCVLGIEFVPEQAGAIQGSVVLADNNLNAWSAFQPIALKGTAPVPVPASTTTALAATPGSAVLGGKVTLTASVTSTTAGTITGSVTFRVGTKFLGMAFISGGSASLRNVRVSSQNGFSVGTDSITAAFNGDTEFTASSGSSNLTVLRRF